MDSPLPDDAPRVVNLTVRTYGETVRKMALEEAARIAEEWLGSEGFIEDDVAGACEGIAFKIRELAAKEKRS